MLDFYRLFADHSISTDTRVNPGWVNVQCPFCPDHSKNLGFNLARQNVNCWRCGPKNLTRALSKVLQMPYEYVDQLADRYTARASLLNSLNGKKVAKAKKLDLPGDSLNSTARKYLRGRGYDPALLEKKYHLRYGGVSGPFKYRLIIPLFVDGELVSWTARAMDKDTDPRYKNLSIEQSVIDPKNTFFNLDHVRGRYAIIQEGAFDVMRMGDGFICSFGTELTPAQIKVLRTRFDKVGFLFDAEPLAQRKALKFASQLASCKIEAEVIDAYGDFLKEDGTPCNDGGDLTPEQALLLREQLFQK